MEILKFPDPALFQVCQPVTVFGPELKVLLDSMWETMVASNGVGLASNQVGLNYRMFCMLDPDKEQLFIINPNLLRRSIVAANLREGCLSTPGEFVTLSERASWIEVEFQDIAGTLHKRVFQGIYAVCVQHETDHLDGKSHLEAASIPKQKRKELAKKWGLKNK